jgi:hypothetical protein
MPVPARVELQIVMAASTLLGLDQEPAMLRGYGTIPAAIAARVLDCANGAAPSPNSDTRLNSDANCVSGGGLGGSSTGVLVRRLLCDPVDGRLIGMDTRTRRYTGRLRQFASWRDQACRLSDAPIVDIDHINRYVDGGPTTVANGQGLSKNSHVLRDHPEVSVRTQPPKHERRDRGEGGPARYRLLQSAPDVEWTMPTGHTYLRRPPPALGWGSGATAHDPAPPPDQLTAARLAAEDARALRRELARRRRRLARHVRKRRARHERLMRASLQ